MSRPVLSWVAVLCGCILVALSTGAACAERRVALVVGNSQYKNPSLVLLNPKHDAEDVAAVLRALDFEVILTVDAGKRELDLAMTQFARSARGADAALFFYAGHALQYQGGNYLMPTDAELEDEVSLRYQMIMLDDVRAAVDRADGVKIIILDACRNNPVVDNLRQKIVGVTRSVGSVRGLARIDKALGSVVAYATAADEVAADGTGRNSPFTSALLKRLQEPGLEIGNMFRRIAADVNEQTNGRQRPETYVSLIGEYYLNQKDRLAWDQVKDSVDPAAFRNFVARFPSSPRASDAQYRLEMLDRLARDKQLEQVRTENEADQARLAAAERARAEREAVQLRQAEEQRARLAAIERERTEHQAPLSHQAEEQRPRLTDTEHEAAPPHQAEEPRAKLTAIEREHLARMQEEDQRAKAAERQKQNGVTLGALPIPQPTYAQPMTQEQACKRDEERLARLRANQSRDEVIRFERELGCERLRPQVLRLRESIIAEGQRSERETTQRPQPEPQRLKADAEPQSLEREDSIKIPPSSITQDQACKRDDERLARLRASQARDEVIRFERELTCERLRPQVARLRESVGAN